MFGFLLSYCYAPVSQPCSLDPRPIVEEFSRPAPRVQSRRGYFDHQEVTHNPIHGAIPNPRPLFLRKSWRAYNKRSATCTCQVGTARDKHFKVSATTLQCNTQFSTRTSIPLLNTKQSYPGTWITDAIYLWLNAWPVKTACEIFNIICLSP